MNTKARQSIKTKGCLQRREVMIINMCPSCQKSGPAVPADLASKATKGLNKTAQLSCRRTKLQYEQFLKMSCFSFCLELGLGYSPDLKSVECWRNARKCIYYFVLKYVRLKPQKSYDLMSS